MSDSVIKQLDFGQDSAEDEELFLQRVFVPTSFFKRIKSGKKKLVLGRKGTGKTAICLRLFNDLKQQDAMVSLITPRDLSKLKMSVLERGSLNKSETALLAWKYTFLMELGVYVLRVAEEKHGSNYIVWPDPIKRVRHFLIANLNDKSNWFNNFSRFISSIRKIELPVLKVGAEVESSNPETSLTDQLDEAAVDMFSSINLLVDELIYLLVDKVDEIWEPSEESKSLIIGLLRASKEVSEISSSVNIVIFLRSDIYDSLEFHDSDKFHSIEERVSWDKSDLKKIITSRARESTKLEVSRLAYDKIWQNIFPRKIDGKESFEYLLQYTFMRPRDLIQLCNLCRDKAQDNNHKKIEEEDVKSALIQYSEWKLRDLRDEYKVQYSFLQKVFLGLFYSNPSRFSRDEITENFKPVKPGLANEFGDHYFEPLDNLLQILYNIGFLGAVIKNKTFYTFLDDKVITAYINDFKVHPVFRSALGLSSKTSGKGVAVSDRITVGDVITGDKTGGQIAVGETSVAVGGNVVGVINVHLGKIIDFSELYKQIEDSGTLDHPTKAQARLVLETIENIINKAVNIENIEREEIMRWLKFLESFYPEIHAKAIELIPDEII